MSDKTLLLLIALAVLATKHVIFDFFLQSLEQIRNKRIYGHPSGLLHAAGHVVGTCLVFLIITPPLVVALGIVVGEFVIHYHADWLKEEIGYRLKLRPDEKSFWIGMGIDQWVHQLTYVGIVAVLALT